jgi:hypothetical protein
MAIKIISSSTAYRIISNPNYQPELSDFWKRLNLLFQNYSTIPLYRESFRGYNFKHNIMIEIIEPSETGDKLLLYVTGPGDGFYHTGKERIGIPLSLHN